MIIEHYGDNKIGILPETDFEKIWLNHFCNTGDGLNARGVKTMLGHYVLMIEKGSASDVLPDEL